MLLNTEAKDELRLFLTAAGIAAVVIVFVICTAVLWPGFYGHDVNWKWIRFSVVTVFFAAYCLKTYWKARKELRFWVILAGVFALHLLGVGHFYYASAGLPLLIFGPVVALEWALLALAVHHFLGIGPTVGRH